MRQILVDIKLCSVLSKNGTLRIYSLNLDFLLDVRFYLTTECKLPHFAATVLAYEIFLQILWCSCLNYYLFY